MAVTALIIDDSKIAREIIRYHFREIGCLVVGEAPNAVEGLQLFRTLKPDIVTIDLMMPIKDDADSMATVRTMKGEKPDAIIVIVSVLAFEKVRQSFFNEGVLDYIVKPFNDFSFKPTRIKLMRAFPELTVAQVGR
jgi:two-component system chemotaxis response regulator CheY